MFLSMLTAALMGSAYANTNYTATPGTHCNPPEVVYGSYTDTGEASGGSVEVFEVAAPEGYECLFDVYGGYVDDTGDATGNTVTMNGGVLGSDDFSGSLFGGYVSYAGDATGNTVTMSGGVVGGHVYGGYVDDTGDATGNTVDMSGGEVYGYVLGGYSVSGEASGNTAIMTGGEVYELSGGYGANAAHGNTVTMNGGYVNHYVNGGYVQDTGDATGNTVTMSGGEVDYDVYGGYVANTGNATGNTVDMSGGEVYGYVLGGYVQDTGDATENAVTINDGYVDSSVYGGYTGSGDASNNIVVMRGGQVKYLEGGYTKDGYGEVNNNTVVLNGGLVEKNLHAGLHSGNGDACNNTSIITGGEVQGWAMGGYGEGEGAVRNNSVHLVGRGATAVINGETYTGSAEGIKLGYVYAAYSEGGGELTGNSINIHGTGTSTGEMGYMQILTFHLGDGLASASAPMITVTNTGLDLEGVELGFHGDAVTDWAAFKGKSITLVNMTNETITGLVTPTDSVDITDEAGKTVATATLTLSEDLQTLFLTDIQGVGPVPPPPPVPAAEADALDVTLVNSLWASSAYVREFVRLSGAQGYALKSGDTTVWGGGFGTFMHATGDKGFKSNGGGYGIGVRHAFSANTQAGISFGQGFGSYHNSGADGATVHQRAILAAATASTRMGKDFSLGGHLAYGSVRNRADCRLDGATERARWNDNVFNLGVQAAYDFHVTEATAITPFLGLDWAYGAQESINGAYGRHYSHGRLNELRMPVGVTVSTSTEAGSTKLLPQLSVAYVPSLAQQLPHAGVTRADGNYRVKGYAPGRNAFMLNAGVNAIFSESWSAGAFYTLETRRHSVEQSVNASVRYTF